MKKYLKLVVVAIPLFFAKGVFIQAIKAQEYRMSRETYGKKLSFFTYERAKGRIIVSQSFYDHTRDIDGFRYYYTLDGTEPTVEDIELEVQGEGNFAGLSFPRSGEEYYRTPNPNGEEVTVKVLAVDEYGNQLPVVTFKYKFASQDIVNKFIQKAIDGFHEREKSLENIVDTISKTAKNDFEKIKMAYDWILRTFKYEHKYWYHSETEEQGLSDETYYVSGLDIPCKDSKEMCTGIGTSGNLAYRLQAVLSRVGIESKILFTEPFTLEYYWNIVKLNGEWYHLNAPYDMNNSKYYRNFLVSDDVMSDRVGSISGFRIMQNELGELKDIPRCPYSYGTRGITKQMTE